MAATFTAVPDLDDAKISITAEGGVTGERFYMIRRDRNGSQLIRETSEIGAMWLADAAAVRTQLAKNPSFEGLSATNVSIRTNLFSNPSFETNTTGLTASYGTTGAGAITRPTTGGMNNGAHARLQWSTASTAVSGYADMASVGSLATGVATVTVYARVNRANQSLRLTLAGTAATGATGITNPIVDVLFNTWTRLTWTGTIATAGTFNLRVNAVAPGRVWDIGDQLDVDWFLAEQRAVVDTYFDGSTAAAGDFTYFWGGTAHGSASGQRGLLPIDVVAPATTGAISSTAWAKNGSKSLRIIPISTSNVTYAAPGGDFGGLRLGMVANKIYTVSATIRLAAAQTGTLLGGARTIVAATKVGAAPYVYSSSAQAPNAAGETRLSVTFAVPSGATEAYVVLYNGASRDNGDVWWDSLLVEEMAPIRTNYAKNPNFETDILNWSAENGMVLTRDTSTPISGTASGKMTGGGDFYSVTTATAGEKWTLSADYKTSGTVAGTPQIFLSSGATSINTPLPLTQTSPSRFSVTIEIPTGSTSVIAAIFGPSGAGVAWVDNILLEKTNVAGSYFDGTGLTRAWAGAVNGSVSYEVGPVKTFFDGSTGTNHAWTGTVNNSTSTNGDAALPIELSDYEARQGLETDYILTNEDGVTSSSLRITIPSWGTWLKDPFRPFMNTKVLWNSDSAYTRQIPQVTLKARGAKYPVVQSDRRMAPNGTIRVLTEDEETARKLIALLDSTSTVMIDVALEFGVPVRYVSVGDITGQRTSSDTDRNLSWQERFWDLPIQEVAAPVGAPVAQSLTYESIPAAFGSYIAIPASVESYNNLSAGLWGQ